uniref:NADH-ubiquinone oxidoreductase chain 2 n=1 Tax=Megabalanus volcano TaxID=266495 RepID=Q65Z13_MEGVO|nr:NADH dehydrogenase subunit 2 [Megabalanus coccopoma]YP_087057.1 NADH dehydrogenase subunit 2 [Megabalanus volcano]UZN92563.1 NADH dehydrogenase subunit 2 [Megabalanus coccopoma]BAD44759.1 NADH dehydrogenase subunit 2 [Megabalanus volcano]
MSIFFPPFIYSFFLFTGTLISVSSSSFFGMWMGLEMNLMAFIPMIVNTEFNKKSSEAAIKYFLIQAFASAMVIFAAFYFYLYGGSFLSKSSNIFITLALSLKLGMAPFHFWFPQVLEGLSWINTLVLLTWQKIAPLVMMSLLFHDDVLLTLALISAVVGAISGINQTSMRKILAFSSISHLGWVTATMCFSRSLWVDYFIFYCITSFILCLSFWLLNLNYFSQLTLTPNLSDKFIIFINLLSLGGLPPLLGFLPKFLAMVVISESFPALGILIFSSLITLYFYIRLCFSTFTLYKRSAAWNQKSTALKNFFVLSILTSVSILGIFPLNLFNF